MRQVIPKTRSQHAHSRPIIAEHESRSERNAQSKLPSLHRCFHFILHVFPSIRFHLSLYAICAALPVHSPHAISIRRFPLKGPSGQKNRGGCSIIPLFKCVYRLFSQEQCSYIITAFLSGSIRQIFLLSEIASPFRSSRSVVRGNSVKSPVNSTGIPNKMPLHERLPKSTSLGYSTSGGERVTGYERRR